MLNEQQEEELKALLSVGRKVVITAHRAPDGDAVGSALGLYHYLMAERHEAVVVLPDRYPHFLHWMPAHGSVLLFEDQKERCTELLLRAEVLFCLDYNDTSRAGDMGPVIDEASGTKVMIDHHRDPAPFADYAISDITSCSTAQLIYRFISMLGGEARISAETADCLYTGIMTDSGSFRFSSTTPETHRITANLLERGARGSRIHELVYDQNSYSKTQLWGYALSNLELICDGGVGLIGLTRSELQKFNYRDGDTEGLVNQPLSIMGVNMSVFVRESRDMVKLSFRSKGDLAVNDLAREHFGGGGHLNAAGGASNLSVEETLKKLKELIPQYIG